jgi:short subunit dehydrogenase-like uncharacterized protein
MNGERTYDIVLFGATGFTGGLTADYLAEHAPQDTRWALAGRNMAKLEAVRDRLADINPACKDLNLLHADITDAASIQAVAEAARVVITTVGPYIEYGEPLVAACARTGTNYVDLTGEPAFVDLMYVRHHEEAVRTGARIVHACGFDSIPYDLGAYYTVQRLPEGVPLRLEAFLRTNMDISGGTLATLIAISSQLPTTLRAERERRKAEPPPTGGRRVRLSRRPTPYAKVNGWTLPMPTIDPQIVLRSAAALDQYGPDFTYGEFLATKRLASAAALGLGSGAIMAMSQVPPARSLLQRLRPQGEGPSADKRAKSWFSVKFVGEAETGEQILTEVAGGDPGYGETAKMLSQSALCLAHDDLPETSGQLTTAVAMGNALITRLQNAGITFRVL